MSTKSPFRFAILLYIAISCNFAFAADAEIYSLDSLRAQLGRCKDYASVAKLCAEYVEHSEDIDVLRLCQDSWNKTDSLAAQTYFHKLAELHPNSARYIYLDVRRSNDPLERIVAARKVISLDPDWPYGHRLMAVTYMKELLEKPEEDTAFDYLRRELPQDTACFRRFFELEQKDVGSANALLFYQLYSKDFASAHLTIEAVKKKNEKWPGPGVEARVLAGMGKFDEAAILALEWADENVASKAMPPKAKDQAAENALFTSLFAADAYDEIIRRILQKDEDNLKIQDYYNLAAAYAMQNKTDLAFEALEFAEELGLQQESAIARDRRFNSLHSDPRWQGLVARVEVNYEKSEGSRHKKALARKADIPIPNWALYDRQGALVRLPQLSGKVLVVTFWSSRAAPCKPTLKQVEDFSKTESASDVICVGVNVMDPIRDAANEFLKVNDVGLNVYFGGDSLAKELKIKGLPFTCVIDKNSNIRYAAPSYREDLPELLGWWSEDLK